jgi:hypothetical protein
MADFLQVVQQLQTISTAPTVPNATAVATDYGELLGKLMDTEYSFGASGRMPLKSLLNLLSSRVGVVESGVADLSGSIVPSINSAVSTINAGLSSYALASDLSAVSTSLASYALGSDVSAISTALLSYAPLADLQSVSTIAQSNASVIVDLSGHVSTLIATTATLALDEATQNALLLATALQASTIQASLVLNELNDTATIGSVSSLSAVVSDLSGVVSGLMANPFDATAIESAIADLSGNRVATLEGSVAGVFVSLSGLDGRVASAESAITTKVEQSAFNDATTNIYDQLTNLGSAIGQKANITDVDFKGVRSKNVAFYYDPSVWSSDALTAGTPQHSAGQQAEAGSLVVVKTLASDNATANAVHLSSPGALSPSDGDLRRFANVGENVLRIKDSDGVVVAELVAGETAGLMYLAVTNEWVLVSGF